MKVSEALMATMAIDRSEREILLAHLMQKDRTWVLAYPEESLTDLQEDTWHLWMERRGRGEPIPYITNTREFYGRAFSIDPRALIPRSSTENLIDLTLEFLESGKDSVKELETGISGIALTLKPWQSVVTVVDVGTGSGCIAITLALERPKLRVMATDISEKALELAQENAKKFGVSDRIHFAKGHHLDPVASLHRPFIIVSNPPYIPEHRVLDPQVARFEPREALFAGGDGMDILHVLVQQAKDHPLCLGIVLECEEAQMRQLRTG